MVERKSPKLLDSVELQAREYELRREADKRVEHQRLRAIEEVPRQICPYISLAREFGAGGDEVAQKVAEKLGMRLLDREILTEMSQRFRLAPGVIEQIDEAPANWLVDAFAHWIDHRVVETSRYVSHLGQVVLAAAHESSAVFVGRGTQFFLPRQRGLLIAIVCPRRKRVQNVAERLGVAVDAAADEVRRKDRARRDYIRRYFKHDPRDPHLYDLVINTETYSIEDAADLVVEQYQRRFPSQ